MPSWLFESSAGAGVVFRFKILSIEARVSHQHQVLCTHASRGDSYLSGGLAETAEQMSFLLKA